MQKKMLKRVLFFNRRGLDKMLTFMGALTLALLLVRKIGQYFLGPLAVKEPLDPTRGRRLRNRHDTKEEEDNDMKSPFPLHEDDAFVTPPEEREDGEEEEEEEEEDDAVIDCYCYNSYGESSCEDSGGGTVRKMSYTELFLYWTPFQAFAGFQLTLWVSSHYKKQVTRIRERVQSRGGIVNNNRGTEDRLTWYHWEIVGFYRMIPWRTLSRTWGFLNSVNLPVWARSSVVTWYSKTFGCELCEAEGSEDLAQFKNLGEFFRRALKPGVRPICPISSIVSPVDGTILFSGPVEGGRVEQVKGISYSLGAFFGPLMDLGKENNCLAVNDADACSYAQSLLKDPVNNCLYTSVIYLAPGDYHRFHSPAQWRVKYRRHFPGELLSVNPSITQWISGLLTLNERAVYVGEWDHGFFSVTAVGATNVGSIKVYQDPSLTTNVPSLSYWMKLKRVSSHAHFHHYDQKLDFCMEKGDAFGEFNLGSTVVLVFEAPKTTSLSTPISNCKVKVGLPLPVPVNAL